MCSILGGTKFDSTSLEIIEKSKDRGRDYFGLSMLGEMWIANHRATPTNELQSPVDNQPFGSKWKIVHNGTIANDMELGNQGSEIDSRVLAEVLDFSSIHKLKNSIEHLKGSFAIAATNGKQLWLICNYKPIFWMQKNDEIYFSSLKHHLGEKSRRVAPYSIFNPITGENIEIDRKQGKGALVICSAGLDSTTVLSDAISKHEKVMALHFLYGCKAEEKEKHYILELSKYYGIEHKFVPIDYRGFAANSTLFSDKKITTGKEGVEYALDWVPARNIVMLSIATAIAESGGFGYIYLGTNLEESGAYPDNEEQFIIDYNFLLYGAVQNGVKIEIKTPLGGLMKKEIVELGQQLGTPYDLTWSCYNGGDLHCGECGPCYMRKMAFLRAEMKDPTTYEK
jgi:7-cyano-7-deazaguanine synthase